MKNYLFILSILIANAIMIVGCDNNPSEVTPNGNSTDVLTGEPDPEAFLFLVKFTDDKYREQIIAENIYNPVRMRGEIPPVVEELIVGTNPWANKLPNGYWIADWRWGNSFIYPSTNVLLSDKWESLTHWNQTWPMPEEIIPFHDYIVEVGGVNRRNIDTLLRVNTDVKRGSELDYMLYQVIGGVGNFKKDIDIPEDLKKEYYSIIRQQDSLHQIYVQRLIDITTNGDFEKVYKRIFE